VTTRAGSKWLLVYDERGVYVARRDSPAAEEARAGGAAVAKFRTLGGAYARLRRDRGAVVQSSP